MDEVYLDFQTRSLQKESIGGPFSLRVQVEQKEHNQVLKKIVEGQKMPQLEKDPLLSKEADLATDMRNISGFVQRSKTMIGAEKDRVDVSKKVDELVHKFVKKLRKNKDKKKAQRVKDDENMKKLNDEFQAQYDFADEQAKKDAEEEKTEDVEAPKDEAAVAELEKPEAEQPAAEVEQPAAEAEQPAEVKNEEEPNPDVAAEPEKTEEN